MIDMGRKISTGSMVQPEESESRVSYPSFSILGDKIPDELSDAKVGGTCRLEIVVKKVGDSIDTYGKGEPRIELEIHKLGYLGKKAVKEEEYQKMSSEEKDDADAKEILDDEE